MLPALDRRTAVPGRPPLLMLALAFGVATYAILSFRAGLAPELEVSFSWLRRIVSTVGGAALFWLILRRLDTAMFTRKSGPIELAAMLAAAGIGLLAVRVGLGWIFPDSEVSLARNLRWTILWLGYLGMGVGLYLAYQLRAAARPLATAAAAPVVADAVPAADIAEAVDWLADAIIAEFAAADVSDRHALADRIAERAGYRVASPLAAQGNCRVEIIERVARRMAR